MAIDVIENVLTLTAAIIGLLLTLFRYFETPKRGWLYVSVFFLTHLLSDYYWTTYTLVMGENPAVSAMMAYFGWNVGYLFLLIAALNHRPVGAKRYFHPLMLLPVPINIWQFFIYIQFGGILNNIWEGGVATVTVCICLQVLLYYIKNKKAGEQLSRFHLLLLLYLISEYGMWTSSCYSWPSDFLNPYYYFSFAGDVIIVLFAWALGRDYQDRGYHAPQKNSIELRLQLVLDIIVSSILFFGCVGGYYMARLMKQSISNGAGGADSYSTIALFLFVLSCFLVVIILLVIFATANHYMRSESVVNETGAKKRGALNLAFTVIITLCLMTASVIYTSRLFYKVSVTGVIEDGSTVAASTANELENYLGVARSTLRVTADSVQIMMDTGASREEIADYIVRQTKNQSINFDDNFTGLYAYMDGKYIDGAGWVPPEGYDVESRDWYKAAVEANGKAIIVSPYVDAQTKSVVITICQLLKDGAKEGSYKNRVVVALDMVVNHVQEITSDVSIDDKGYAMVLNYDGLIIAHKDKKYNAQNINDIFGKHFMRSVIRTGEGYFKEDLNGKETTLFVDRVMGQWYVVIPVSDTQLFEDIYHQLMVNVVVTLVISILISFFYYIGYKNEQLNAKKLEELRSETITQEYEARMLKIEKAAADDANKAKSQFLAQMSHEIRTPINAVLGMNEMVIRETKDSNILEYSHNIQSAGRTLLFLINSILDFSKIEDGKMELVPVSYDISSMINDLVHSIDERAREKKLEFIVHVDETLPSELYGDDVRIRQIIMNLLTNAVKYTDTGSVTLEFANDGVQDDKLTLYVAVRDTGIGIRREDIKRLFTPFERIDEQRNRNIEGTGLGMAIVTEFLRMMDSELEVESVYGEGSVFSFKLRQDIISREPVGSFEERLKAISTNDGDRDYLIVTGADVLVVDDNSMNRKVAAGLMKKNGIEAELAASGAEAIDMVRQKSYDIIFLDHMMPKMDGIEALDIMRGQHLLPGKTKVIALTANAVDGAKDRYMKAGFDGYLSKPIETDQLELLLRDCLPPEMTMWAKDRDDTLVLNDNRHEEEKNAQKNAATDEETAVSEEGGILPRLADIGIDVETALTYCGDDEEFYLEILQDYIDAYNEKISSLSDFYENENWKEYQILVHAIKSTSLSVGAVGLSEQAKALEFAAKDKEIETIKSGHPGFLDDYSRLVQKIGGII